MVSATHRRHTVPFPCLFSSTSDVSDVCLQCRELPVARRLNSNGRSVMPVTPRLRQVRVPVSIMVAPKPPTPPTASTNSPKILVAARASAGVDDLPAAAPEAHKTGTERRDAAVGVRVTKPCRQGLKRTHFRSVRCDAESSAHKRN